MTLLDGKVVSAKLKEELAEEIQDLDFQPGLTVILVGDNPASQSYVGSKERIAKNLGIQGEVIRMPKTTTQSELLEQIEKLNRDERVDGILVQLPVPDQIDENAVIEAIDPAKDVDCFHPYNFGRLFAGNQIIAPCTPWGVVKILEEYGIDITGMNALVIGRSNIVGKPQAMLLMQKNATVTIAHSRTKNLEELIGQSDLIVAAIGRPNFVKGEWVKKGAILIDVGINRVEDSTREKGYRIVGDIDFDSAKEKASYITPVPGGVGLMTTALLMRNTIELAKARRK